MKNKNINPDDDAIFVPAEEIRSIEYVLDKLEQAHQEFKKAVTILDIEKNDKSNT